MAGNGPEHGWLDVTGCSLGFERGQGKRVFAGYFSNLPVASSARAILSATSWSDCAGGRFVAAFGDFTEAAFEAKRNPALGGTDRQGWNPLISDNGRTRCDCL